MTPSLHHWAIALLLAIGLHLGVVGWWFLAATPVPVSGESTDAGVGRGLVLRLVGGAAGSGSSGGGVQATTPVSSVAAEVPVATLEHGEEALQASPVVELMPADATTLPAAPVDTLPEPTSVDAVADAPDVSSGMHNPDIQLTARTVVAPNSVPRPRPRPTPPAVAANRPKPPVAASPPPPSTRQAAVRRAAVPASAPPASDGRGETVAASAGNGAATAGKVAPTGGDVAGSTHSGGGGESSAALQRRYHGQLASWLNRHKRYPQQAQRRRLEGTVQLFFVMDQGGRVLSHRIIAGSGHALLDREAEAMLGRAAPLPAIPPELALSRLEVTVPITFSLR